MGGKRQAGWPSLLVTFLLATQEKSDSAAKGRRKLLLYAQVSSQACQLKCDACLRRHDEARVQSAECGVHFRRHGEVGYEACRRER